MNKIILFLSLLGPLAFTSSLMSMDDPNKRLEEVLSKIEDYKKQMQALKESFETIQTTHKNLVTGLQHVSPYFGRDEKLKKHYEQVARNQAQEFLKLLNDIKPNYNKLKREMARLQDTKLELIKQIVRSTAEQKLASANAQQPIEMPTAEQFALTPEMIQMLMPVERIKTVQEIKDQQLEAIKNIINSLKSNQQKRAQELEVHRKVQNEYLDKLINEPEAVKEELIAKLPQAADSIDIDSLIENTRKKIQELDTALQEDDTLTKALLEKLQRQYQELSGNPA